MMFSRDSKSSGASLNGVNSPEGRGASTGAPSIISADLKIVGDLKSSGDIQIDGTVEGDIDSRALVIGEGATVKGSIVADTVRISGSANGHIQAKTVMLAKTAKVIGDVTHETLTMEAGAALEGGVRRMNMGAAGIGTKVSPFRSPGAGSGESAAGGASSSH